MRLESGTCNVCSAPCSSCMHLNNALTGSKAEEFSDENCRSGEANNQYSMNEGNVYSLSSRARDNLQHTVSETSDILGSNSNNDSLSGNAESRQILSKDYQDSKHLESHDDNTSCISRTSDATLVNGRFQRNADRINISCSSASVSHLWVGGSGSAPCIDMSAMEIPSCKDASAGHSSSKVQRLYGQSRSDKSLSGNPSLMHVERGSESHKPEKLSECSVENSNTSLTKERAPGILAGEKYVAGKDNLIDGTASVSLKVCPKSEADTDNGICDAKDEERKYLVHDGQHEKVEELVKSPGKKEPQSEDVSDESDVVEQDVKVCDICGDAGREDLLAICCRCTDGAEHTYCMREMLGKVPEEDWLCEECKDAEEAENKRMDVEEKKIIKNTSTSQVSSKTLSDSTEVAPPAAKRQALELNTGSSKASSLKRLVPLSRESSFKSLDKVKGKLSLQMPIRNHSGGDNTETDRSPSTAPRRLVSKSMLLKSNSSNNLHAKPRVKLVDEVFPPRTKGGNEHTSKNVETPARMTSKSTLFKSSSLGRSSVSESKVKMLSPKSATALDMKGSRYLKESGVFDRKFLCRSDRPVASSVVSMHKGDQKLLTPRGETTKPSAVNNNRELKVHQDGKLSASSISINNISRKRSDSQVSSERTSTIVDEALQDVLPRSRETAKQVEKSRESFSDRARPVVPTTSKSSFCQKCKSCHSLECCTAGTIQDSGAEISVTASSISKEEIDKGNRLKAAIQAALLRRPEIYRKKEVSNQTDEVSTTGTELNCEVTSQDQMLVSDTLNNSISAEETHEQQEVLENSTSDSSKCSSASDLKQLNSYPTDLCSQLGKSESVGLTAQQPLVGDLSNKAMVVASFPPKMLAFPEYEYIWQGIFEVHRSGKPPDLCAGVQAHLSSCASPKVLKVVTKFLPKVSLNEVSRSGTWPSQFHNGGAREENIALYFFARDVESYERHYKGLLDHMIRYDLVLKGIFDGVELLIFPSNQLPENSQRWNMLFFLWGVFRGKRTNHSDSPKKICIPSLNAMPIEENSSTAVLTLSEHCLSKCMDENSINCDKTCNVLPPSTSIDQCQTVSRNNDINCQTHLCSQVSLEKLEIIIDNKSTSRVPRSKTLSCQEMKSTGSSLKANVLEDGQCIESKPLEAMRASASNKMLEAKTDTDVFIKQENTLSSVIPSVSSQERDVAHIISMDETFERMNGNEEEQRTKRKLSKDCHYIDLEETLDNQETGTASNIGMDKTSQIMNIEEDQERPKKKQRNDHYIDLEATDAAINMAKDKISEKMDVAENQQRFMRKAKDDHYIDLEETLQDDVFVEGIGCQLPNNKEVHYVKLSDTIIKASGVGCQKRPLNEVNDKLEDGESSSQKLRTGFRGIYGGHSSGGRDSFNESFTSLRNDIGSCSSMEGKGCEKASDKKIISEELGSMERTFFPVDTQSNTDSHLVLNNNNISVKGLHEYNDGIPSLELALGGGTKLPLPPPPPPAPKGMLPFLVGAVDRKNNGPDGLADGQEDDGVAASLALSLSFPSSNKEHTYPASAELLPDGNRVNTPFLLFGRYTDK